MKFYVSHFLVVKKKARRKRKIVQKIGRRLRGIRWKENKEKTGRCRGGHGEKTGKYGRIWRKDWEI